MLTKGKNDGLELIDKTDLINRIKYSWKYIEDSDNQTRNRDHFSFVPTLKKRSAIVILQRIYLYKRFILVTSLPEVEPESMKGWIYRKKTLE